MCGGHGLKGARPVPSRCRWLAGCGLEKENELRVCEPLICLMNLRQRGPPLPAGRAAVNGGGNGHSCELNRTIIISYRRRMSRGKGLWDERETRGRSAESCKTEETEILPRASAGTCSKLPPSLPLLTSRLHRRLTQPKLLQT